MEAALAVLVGLMVACSVWLMLSGHLMRFLFGIGLLSNAVNLAIFAVGRLSWAAPSLVPPGALVPEPGVGNALPQALILTAIVIGFGLFSFALAVIYRARAVFGTVEGDAIRAAEPEDGTS
jgi:multicomponent Na+:H+ antiporter subunit C